jgi:hypothetical protein
VCDGALSVRAHPGDAPELLLQALHSLQVAPAHATVLNQLLNTVLRAIAEDRKIREAEELEHRVARLEEKEGSEWVA